MGPIPAVEMDAWLRAGGTVVAASDRAARATKAAYHRARLAEGLKAWSAPCVLDWNSFARAEWAGRTSDGRLLLNPVQEQSLWSRIVSDSGHTDGWLTAPRQRLADFAMEAHDLLAAYAPHLLRPATRATWQHDTGAFSTWLDAFDERSHSGGLLSPGRLPLELLPLLENDPAPRPPLVLAGFDRLLPIQRRLFDTWGEWRQIALGDSATDDHFYAAPNEQSELAACALWCSQHLAANPQSRLLVIAQDANQRRGEIERAFLKHFGAAEPVRFEFSLGIPLAQVGLARGASLLLHWLDGALDEHEVDWLLASGTPAPEPGESQALQSYMRTLRRRNLQRTRWTLDAFLRQPAASAPAAISWMQRMTNAQRRLRSTPRQQSPLEWAALSSQLLDTMGWPGARPRTSAEFQIASRWQQALDQCGSLGFDGRLILWSEFLSDLARTLDQTLFAEESQDAPILIAGPAESAGLTADAIWFLGADESAWPARGITHPLLPLEVQRAARMPHASPQLDWELADSITHRLLSSAPQACFSYARQKEGLETRPSRLVTQVAGNPQTLPNELEPLPAQHPLTVVFEDTTRVALPSASAKKSTPQLSLFDAPAIQPEGLQIHEVPGGATVLTAQSQCAFKAFATTRLGAQTWEPAEAGLTPSERGRLLHAVLHSIWGGPPQGIRTFAKLHELGADLRPWVEDHVHRVLEEKMPAEAREQMPSRYLELEEHRLTRLVTEWLEYERIRQPFIVDATEVDATPVIAGLTLKLRLDRVDRLNDGSLLVIDYKSGNVSPKSWDLPRPDDVQLPLYAEFALDKEEQLNGLVFARIRPGDMCFTGKVASATATLDSTLTGNSGLVKSPLTPSQRSEWKEALEQLARDFIAGRADVDPRDYPTTCERCGLYTLCRVRERDDELEPEDEDNGAEAGDE